MLNHVSAKSRQRWLFYAYDRIRRTVVAHVFGELRFRRSANSLTLINPTPYYLTVTELNAGTRVLENALVPPMGESTVKLPSDAGSNITYRTINDYGALTPKMTGVME
nr:IS1 family transposase [Escherichia coli]